MRDGTVSPAWRVVAAATAVVGVALAGCARSGPHSETSQSGSSQSETSQAPSAAAARVSLTVRVTLSSSGIMSARLDLTHAPAPDEPVSARGASGPAVVGSTNSAGVVTLRVAPGRYTVTAQSCAQRQTVTVSAGQRPGVVHLDCEVP
jgi:hypothetical protein